MLIPGSSLLPKVNLVLNILMSVDKYMCSRENCLTSIQATCTFCQEPRKNGQG